MDKHRIKGRSSYEWINSERNYIPFVRGCNHEQKNAAVLPACSYSRRFHGHSYSRQLSAQTYSCHLPTHIYSRRIAAQTHSHRLPAHSYPHCLPAYISYRRLMYGYVILFFEKIYFSTIRPSDDLGVLIFRISWLEILIFGFVIVGIMTPCPFGNTIGC